MDTNRRMSSMRSFLSTLGFGAAAVWSVALPPAAHATPRGTACTCASAAAARGASSLMGYVIPELGGRDAYRATPVAKGKLYVTNELEGNLTVIDAVTKQPIRKVLFGYKVPNTPYEMVFTPRGLAVAPDGQSVWVTAPIPQSDCAGGEGGGL